MTIAFVTATKIEASTGGSASGTVTGTAGNCWIGVGGHIGSAVLTFSGGGTWTNDVTGANGTKAYINIANAPNITGGSQTVTCGGAGASAKVTGIVIEFSGLATSSVLDSTPPAIGTGASTSATTGSETNSNANVVFVAGVTTNLTTGNPITLTGNTASWNYNPNSTDETNAVSFEAMGTGYLIVSSVGSQSSNWTVTSNSWAAAIAAYKAAAAPPPTIPNEAVIVNQSVTNAVSF